MDRLEWPTAIKVIVGLMVAGMVAGTVLLVIQVNGLIAPFPEETGVFTEDIQAGNEFITSQYPLDFTQGALFALGFAALGLLGPLLARLSGPGDSRGPILAGRCCWPAAWVWPRS